MQPLNKQRLRRLLATQHANQRKHIQHCVQREHRDIQVPELRHRVDGAPDEVYVFGEGRERLEEAGAGEQEDEGGDGGDYGDAVGKGDDEARGEAVLKHVEDADDEDSLDDEEGDGGHPVYGGDCAVAAADENGGVGERVMSWQGR